MTIVEAIARTGGFTPLAAPDKTTVTRHVRGRKVRHTVPLKAICHGRCTNFVLLPGDVVFVPERVN